MAENRQYITRTQENGSVLISEDVIATIALNALSENEGFAGLCSKPGSDLMDMIGKKNRGKGIRVDISEDEELTVECDISIYYGYSVMAVAKNIQDSVSSAVESSTGLKVLHVNVNVCGIIRG